MWLHKVFKTKKIACSFCISTRWYKSIGFKIYTVDTAINIDIDLIIINFSSWIAYNKKESKYEN